jgi:hypothetical protein
MLGKRITLSSLLALGMLASVADAQATCFTLGEFTNNPELDLDEVYPGVMCRFYGTAATDTYFSPSGGHGTGLLNTNNSTIASVTCPILSAHGEITKPGALEGDVSITGGTGWVASNCSLVATSWDGTTVYSAPTPVLNHTGNDWDFVWNNWACSGGPSDPSPFSSYAFTCDVKGGARIQKYEYRAGTGSQT